MATYTVLASIIGSAVNFNFTQIAGGAGQTSSNPIDMAEGDVLTVSFTEFGSQPTLTVSGFDSARWSYTSNMSFATTSNASRTIKTSPTLGAETLTGSGSGLTSDTIHINIVAANDTLPDNIDGDLGTDKNDANPGQIYDLGIVTVTGITSTVSASVTGAGNIGTIQYRKSLNDSFQTTGNLSINNNGKIYIRAYAPTNYDQSGTVTLKVGGNLSGTLNTDYVQDVITIATTTSNLVRIPFPITYSSGTQPEIDMGTILTFFGYSDYAAASYTRPDDIGSYYRDGDYVPNITTGSPNNSSVPNSGVSIELPDFYNTMTTFYFQNPPVGRVDSVTSVAGTTKTAKLVWSLQDGAGYYQGATQTNNWSIGFGPGAGFGCRYRWKYSGTKSGNTNDVTFNEPFTGNNGSTTVTGSFTSFSTQNTYVEISMSTNNAVETEWSGTFTLEAIHPNDSASSPQYEIAATFPFTLMLTGV